MKKGVALRFAVQCAAVMALGSCTDTGPIAIGANTYTISTRVALGGPAAAKGEALKEASSFCTSQGKEMLLQREHSDECALHGGCGEAEIFFNCLAPGDPRLRNPRFRSGPNEGEIERE